SSRGVSSPDPSCSSRTSRSPRSWQRRSREPWSPPRRRTRSGRMGTPPTRSQWECRSQSYGCRRDLSGVHPYHESQARVPAGAVATEGSTAGRYWRSGIVMAQGRHSRGMLGRAWWMGLLAIVVAVLLGAGTAFAAYGYDRSSRTRILPGVRVGGIAVGGMTRDQAIRAVTARADTSLAGDLLVTAAGYSWHVTPAALGTRADVNGAVDQAFAAADGLSLLSRVFYRVAGESVHADIPVKYAHDQGKVRAFVQQAYDEVTEPAVDAGMELVGDEVVMRKSKPGEELKAQGATARILRAIDRRLSSVQVPVKAVEPKVTAATLGKTIVVDLSENQLYLYDGFKVEREYPVATAAPGYSTPVGS